MTSTRLPTRFRAGLMATCLVLLAIAPVSASSETGGTQAAQKPAKKSAVGAARPAAEAPIICTKYGCAPLPPHCHAETEFNWEGPTGYQIIICP